MAVVSLLAIALVTTAWAVLAALPVWLLSRSAVSVWRGAWRVPKELERAVAYGFWGMLLIPLTLTAAFLALALQRD